jgi:hypothetical protein
MSFFRATWLDPHRDIAIRLSQDRAEGSAMSHETAQRLQLCGLFASSHITLSLLIRDLVFDMAIEAKTDRPILNIVTAGHSTMHLDAVDVLTSCAKMIL